MMSNGSTGSILPRRALGRQLQIFRERAGLSRSAAGRVIGVSVQTIGRLEEGLKTKVSDLYVNALSDGYGLSDGERRMMLDLAVEVRTTTVSDGSWWRPSSRLDPADFKHFIALEAAASEVFTWQTALVPGLLQTREYRRALAWAKFPGFSGERIEEMLDVATLRQKRIQDADFQISAVVSEAVLRYQVGSSAVMAEQSAHLLTLSELPNISVRIVRSHGNGEFGLITSHFVVFSFPRSPSTALSLPPVAYVECYTGDVYVEQDPQLSCYTEAAERIRRVASDPLASKIILQSAVKEWDQ